MLSPLFAEVEALLDNGMTFEEVDEELGMEPGFSVGLFSKKPTGESLPENGSAPEPCKTCGERPSSGAEHGPYTGLCDGCIDAKRKVRSKTASKSWADRKRRHVVPEPGPLKHRVPAFERIFGGNTERSRRLLATLEEFREAEDDLDARLDVRVGMSRPAPDSRQIVYSFAGKAKRVAAALAAQQDLSWWELTDHQRERYVELALRVLEAVEAVEAAEDQIRASLGRREMQ